MPLATRTILGLIGGLSWCCKVTQSSDEALRTSASLDTDCCSAASRQATFSSAELRASSISCRCCLAACRLLSASCGSHRCN